MIVFLGPSIAGVQAGESGEPGEAWSLGIDATAGFPGSTLEAMAKWIALHDHQPWASISEKEKPCVIAFRDVLIADFMAPMSLRPGPRARSARCKPSQKNRQPHQKVVSDRSFSRYLEEAMPVFP